MSTRHWTLTATHLGQLSDAEFALVSDAIEEVLKFYHVLPGKAGEYSILGAVQAEYEKARGFRRFDSAMEEWRQA